jgi:hypothetical protein
MKINSWLNILIVGYLWLQIIIQSQLTARVQSWLRDDPTMADKFHKLRRLLCQQHYRNLYKNELKARQEEMWKMRKTLVPPFSGW